MAGLPTQVDDRPMTFALLDVIDRWTSEFVVSKPASQEDGK